MSGILETAAREGHYLGDVVDARPGQYYVSVIDHDRMAWLAGPYPTHQQALDRVQQVRRLAAQYDARSHWYQFGTCRAEPDARPVKTFFGLLEPDDDDGSSAT